MSDESRIRVEELLLFYEGQPADEAAAAQSNREKRAIISGSVQDNGTKGSKPQGGRGGDNRRGEGTGETSSGRAEKDEDPWAWSDPCRDPEPEGPLWTLFKLFLMAVFSAAPCLLIFWWLE